MKDKRKSGKSKLKLFIGISVIAALVVILIVVNIFIPLKYLGAYIVFKKDKLADGTMRVRFLNVGYGDCSLVEFPDGKTMLIDGGTGTYANVHMLLKTLNSDGIDKIDYLVCTSVKSEHCGSLAEIVRYKEIGIAYIPGAKYPDITDEYAEFIKRLSENGVKTEVAGYGKGVYSPDCGCNFFFLSPSATFTEYDDMNFSPTADNIDAASIALWIGCYGRGLLFLSDATPAVQQKIAGLMELEGGKYFFDGMEFGFSDCAAVKAASHCASGSVVAELYDLLQPETSIISVGQNAAKCPSAEDIALLRLYSGDKVFRTDESGSVTLTLSADNLTVEKEFR